MGSLAQPNMSTQPTNRRLSLSQAQIPVAGRPISCLRTPVNFRVNHRLPVSRSAATLERSEVQRPSSEGLDRITPDDNQQTPQLSAEHSLQDSADFGSAENCQHSHAQHQHSNQILGLDKGVWVAAGLITAWATMIHITVFHTPLHSLQAVALFWPMMQLHTGVFITAHDAMHGAIAPSNPKLNQIMGRLAGTLYAGLDYDTMKVAHHEHHLHTGIQEKDPDFHSGNPGLLPWAGKFIKKYLTIKQMVILNLMVGAVQISGAPYKNMVVFLLCAGLLSAAQLFYFGTYVPHRPPKDNPQQVMSWEKSNPTWATTRLASFVTCYHFDCHVEHHHNPRLAWYELWGARKQALQAQ
ncbi:hypothetical protein WJX82_002471 [Trebouxia sp. C0006]